MNKKNLYNCNQKTVNPNYFNGNVIIKAVYNETNSQDQELYFVEFLNGALTTIHFHETEQILIPMYGKGVVGEIKKNTILNFELDDIELKFLDVGEIVSIPSNILHFHGALPNQNFTHVAFRKFFEYACINNEINSYPTQTKWIYDFISDELGSNDSNLIHTTLQTISKKVSHAVENILIKDNY
jgi:quercetin dioxygenase-like cupin family protein